MAMETVVSESTYTINSDCFMPIRSMDEEREKIHLSLDDLTFGIGWSERLNLVTRLKHLIGSSNV